MSRSVLEDFVRDYVEIASGAWDEVEPQVYDLLLPPDSANSRLDNPTVVRVAFDPEALVEHPGAQLASFGTPLVDALLNQAIDRGRFCQLFFLGLNLTPRELPHAALRSLHLDGGLEYRLESMRALSFPQAFFWFQATFISDQKEQEVVPVGVDLHFGRHVRHYEKLLDPSRLSDLASVPLPEAPHLSLQAALPIAQEEAGRTFASLAHVRDRELKERLARQAERLRRYYADMRGELDAAPARGKSEAEVLAQRNARKLGLDREEASRIAELRQKSALHVEVRLVTTLLVQQPKILLRGQLLLPKRPAIALDLVWDPLSEALGNQLPHV